MTSKAAYDQRIQETVTTYRWAFVIAGAVSAVIGVLVLVWPNVMGNIFSTLMAVYALAAGVLYGVIVIRGTELSPLVRVGRGLIALALIIGAILIVLYMDTATAVIVNMVGIVLGLMWISEGVMAFLLSRRLQAQTWLLAYAIGAVIAGVVMLLTPVWDGKPVTILVGCSLLGLGVAQIVRGVTATRFTVTTVEETEGV